MSAKSSDQGAPAAPPLERVRNFAIIAHIDHGKSTLADRLMEVTGAVSKRDQKAQYLDNMELERERGITIKAQTVVLQHRAEDGQIYTLNLIDTPGHVDFSYEVSRSLSACEGALLVVDAAQGVEAQTLSPTCTSPSRTISRSCRSSTRSTCLAPTRPVCSQQIEDGIGLEVDHAQLVSAKSGEGIDALLQAIVQHVPPPEGDRDAPLQALMIDSWFDTYVGVVVLVRVVHGVLCKRGDKIVLMATGAVHEVNARGGVQPPGRRP